MPLQLAPALVELCSDHPNLIPSVYNEFRNAPTTRFLISLIPPTDNPDLLNALLEAAFTEGTRAAFLGIVGGAVKRAGRL